MCPIHVSLSAHTVDAHTHAHTQCRWLWLRDWGPLFRERASEREPKATTLTGTPGRRRPLASYALLPFSSPRSGTLRSNHESQKREQKTVPKPTYRPKRESEQSVKQAREHKRLVSLTSQSVCLLASILLSQSVRKVVPGPKVNASP